MSHLTKAKPTSGAVNGTRRWSVSISDKHIIRATQYWAPDHSDAPRIDELIELRNIIAQRCRVRNLDLLCLSWLRNRYVALRKAGLCFSGKAMQASSS